MKNHRLGRVTTILSIGALGLAACGGSDGGSLSGADAELAEALAAVWEDEGEFPDGVSTSCVANGLIGGIGGADGAENYGVDADNVGDDAFDENPLEQDDALAAAEAMLDCDGLKESLITEISGATDDGEVSCLIDALDDEPLTALFASGFMGDAASELEERYENEFEEDFAAGLESCDISS